MATFGKIGAGTLLNHKRFAKEYVQDGLVALYDGIENAGWGVHNPNATIWTDLTGLNGQTKLSGTYGWSKTACINTSTNASNVYTSPAQFTINKPLTYLARMKASGEGTIEFVFRLGVNRTGQTLYGPQAYSASQRFCMNYNNNSDSPIRNGFVAYNFLKGLERTFRPDDSTYAGLKYSRPYSLVSTMIKNGSSGTTWRTYTNGAYTSQGTSASSGFNWADSAVNSTSPCSIYQCVYALRWYSRALTAAEIAYNYSIDKARFLLP